nr:phosphoribosyltransferase family protein [uncultured Flavobacterium sp.]
MKNIILNKQEIAFKTKRIAYQIFETFVDEEEIVIAGISKSGYTFSQKIADELEKISNIKIIRCEVEINKNEPHAEIKTSLTPQQYQNKSIVLVDDVLNSGATLIYGVKHFLNVPLKKLKTAVLINRNHKNFPIKADYKGISLSTSLHEHIQVVFNETDEYAYLS